MTSERAETRRKAAPVAAPGLRWPADAVERRPVAALVPYVRNARTHSPEQVAQIAASIRHFGWTFPVLVGDDGTIIAGHGRVLAAQSLGIAEVPVMVAAGWSEAQKRAYVIADNKLALNAGWDAELLSIELGDLKSMDFDLGLTGFGELELGKLLGDDGSADPDEAPEPPAAPITKPGDLWICGEHRVLCGDATIRADVDKLLDGELADMAFSDPPYNVDYANSAKDKLRGKNRPILNDALGEGFGAFLQAASTNMLAVTKGAIYICMSSSELHTLYAAFTSAGGHWSTFLIWSKNGFTLGRSHYQRQYEPILYGWRQGSPHYWCGDRSQGDVWCEDKPYANKLHPTMKPVELIERAIHNSSREGSLVLDLFGGSGSTLIACERTGRHARIVELDPVYVDVIVRRWQELTDIEATLESDGRSFREITAERVPLMPEPDSSVTGPPDPDFVGEELRSDRV